MSEAPHSLHKPLAETKPCQDCVVVLARDNLHPSFFRSFRSCRRQARSVFQNICFVCEPHVSHTHQNKCLGKRILPVFYKTDFRMEVIACRDCDAGDAASAFCATCSAYYCSVCAAYHARRRASKDHAISLICGSSLPAWGAWLDEGRRSVVGRGAPAGWAHWLAQMAG